MRESQKRLIERVLALTLLDQNSRVLEISCGEGDYLITMKEATSACVFGVDFSADILIQARGKNPELSLVLGGIEKLPFREASLDLVYMIEPPLGTRDWSLALREIRNILRDRGEICIVMRSNGQAEEEMLGRYFPSLQRIRRRRRPGVYRISQVMKDSGFINLESQAWEGEILSGLTFLRAVESRAYAELSSLSEREFEEGLERLRAELGPGSLFRVSRYTLIRARK